MEAKFLKQYENMWRITQNKFAKKQINEGHYDRLSKNTLNMARKIVGRNNLGPGNLLVKAVTMSHKKLVPATTTIQRAFRRTRAPMTNEKFIRLVNKWQKGNNRGLNALTTYANKKYGTENLNMAINMMYENRHQGTSPAVKRIQTAWRARTSDRLRPVKAFIKSLEADDRFNKYYTGILIKLFTYTTHTLSLVKSYPNVSPKKIISKVIGQCHINPEQVPAKYLGALINQLVYVSRAYNKMSTGDKIKYRDRLDENLGGRPCLENILDALIESLVEPVFIWVGKKLDPPLVKNNARYLNNVMAKAVSSWALSKNKKPNSLRDRKKVFWTMVRNRELYVRNSEGVPVYSTPAKYNVWGKKFFKSNLAQSLGNFD